MNKNKIKIKLFEFKRGEYQLSDVPNYIWKIFLIIFVFIMVMIVTNSALKLTIDTFDTEAEILSYKLFYSRGGISVYDSEIDRVYPGIIDLEKFLDTENMESELMNIIEYKADTDYLSAKIEIFDEGIKMIDPVYFNRYHFLRWYPIAMTKAKGDGGAKLVEKSYYVLLKDKRQKELWTFEKFKEDPELIRSWDVNIKPQYEDLKENYEYEDIQLIPAKIVITIVRPNS
jgi:hypothetical protein